MSRTRLFLLLGAAIPLAACGADDIASPGTGGNIIINNPAPTPAPSPAPSPTPTPTAVIPADKCPNIDNLSQLTDSGTITSPGTGTFRVCTLPARFTASSQLPKIAGLLYRLGGRVDVGNDLGATPVAGEAGVTLTIDPGVIVFAGTGVSWINVNRGNKISAVGTATQPIILTSRENVLGLNDDDNTIGQWGGLVLSGRAQITDCDSGTAGTATCSRQTEGATDAALYGGATNTDNSGTVRFMQIRYSGFILSADKELQSLTTQGIGRGTQIDHIMSFNSSDDGAEFFGGRVNMKYFISVGADDDNLDTDVGTKANFQFVLVAQRTKGGDAIIEADTDNTADGDLPRQNTIVSNMTALYRSPGGPDQAAILLRGGTDYTLANSILVAPNYACLRISRANTVQAANAAQDELGPPVFRSDVLQCGATKYIGSNGPTAADVQTIFGSGANNNNDAFTPTLANLFVNGANETAVPAFDVTGLNADPQVTGGFFTAVTYIGAFKDANDTWYKGWVCNSTVVDFGLANTTGLCSKIPVL